MRPKGPNFKSLDWQLEVVDRRRWTCKVQDVIQIPWYVHKLGNIVVSELEILLTKEMLDIADNSIDENVRKENYKKAFARISGELYWLPMFTYAKYYAYSKDLDFKATPDEIPRFYTAKWK